MPRKIWSAVWRICALLLIWGALLAPFLIPFSRPSRLNIELATATTLFTSVWIMRSLVERQPLVSLGFSSRHFLRDSAVGLSLGIAMMTICIAFVLAFGFAHALPAVNPSVSAVGFGAVAMLVNTFTQELLVRGYMQQTLNSIFGAAASIYGAAVLFVLLHAGVLRSPLPALNLFLAGLLLGLAYATTGNLWLPTALHFGWNFTQELLGLVISGQRLFSGWRTVVLDGPAMITGGDFGIEGGLPATAVTAAGLAIVWILFGRRYSARQMASAAP
jgi:membrane protease YdiL (CAAX protease family)